MLSLTAAAPTAAAGTPADTLWLILATVLALLMAPGVAFFYGGLVRARAVVNMMMMSFGAMAIIGVLWVVYGYGIVFGPTWIPHLAGHPFSQIGLEGVLAEPSGDRVHDLALAAFQATFAIDVVALLSGAIADRARFGSWMVFAALCALVVYFAVARWLFFLYHGQEVHLRVNHSVGAAV